MSDTVTVINQGREPLMLEDGTVLGAAYTPEAKREGVTLSAKDRRHVASGRLVIVETPKPKAEPRPVEVKPAVAKGSAKPADDSERRDT
jgi:hypothetical protein